MLDPITALEKRLGFVTAQRSAASARGFSDLVAFLDAEAAWVQEVLDVALGVAVYTAEPVPVDAPDPVEPEPLPFVDVTAEVLGGPEGDPLL